MSKDYIDRFQLIVRGNADPTPKQEDMLVKFRKAFSLMATGYSKLKVAREISRQHGISESQSFKIVRDAEKIFGKSYDADKDGMRAIHYENYMRLGKKAEKAGKLNVAASCFQKASDLYGLELSDSKNLIDPRAFLKPGTIIFSDDPAVFEANEREETEDTDYEEFED